MKNINEVQEMTHTMSTREIAEMVGKRHDNVLRDFRRLCEQLELDAEQYCGTYRHAQNGQKYTEYRLDDALTIALVVGYDAKIRHALAERWVRAQAGMSFKDFYLMCTRKDDEDRVTVDFDSLEIMPE